MADRWSRRFNVRLSAQDVALLMMDRFADLVDYACLMFEMSEAPKL